MSSKLSTADVMRANESVIGAPALTSNHCHALARALNSAAPVVERQPIGMFCDGLETGPVIFFGSTLPPHGTKFYTAPPELAELQAKNEELDQKYSMSFKREVGMRLKIDELQATIAQLETKLNNAINLDFERRAEIERLKGGKIECGACPGCENECRLDRDSPQVGDEVFYIGEPLRNSSATQLVASQPAPVSVVCEKCSGEGKVLIHTVCGAAHKTCDACTTRPSHANAPADSGTHPHNDGLDDYRGSKK